MNKRVWPEWTAFVNASHRGRDVTSYTFLKERYPSEFAVIVAYVRIML